MKLKELLEDTLVKTQIIEEPFMRDSLHSEALEKIKEYLLQCDEFKEVDELVILKSPVIENDTGKILQASTYKLGDNMKFKKKAYLLSVDLSPEIFDSTKSYKPVKDGAYVIPNGLDPYDLSRINKIAINYSPDKVKNNKEEQKRLVKIFKNILKSPEDYKIEGKRYVTIRGLFEEIDFGGVIKQQELGDINLDYDNQSFFIVFYLDYIINKDDENNVEVKIEKQILPIIFKESFKKRFKDKTMITKDELNSFLKDNNIEI